MYSILSKHYISSILDSPGSKRSLSQVDGETDFFDGEVGEGKARGIASIVDLLDSCGGGLRRFELEDVAKIIRDEGEVDAPLRSARLSIEAVAAREEKLR